MKLALVLFVAVLACATAADAQTLCSSATSQVCMQPGCAAPQGDQINDPCYCPSYSWTDDATAVCTSDRDCSNCCVTPPECRAPPTKPKCTAQTSSSSPSLRTMCPVPSCPPPQGDQVNDPCYCRGTEWTTDTSAECTSETDCSNCCVTPAECVVQPEPRLCSSASDTEAVCPLRRCASPPAGSENDACWCPAYAWTQDATAECTSATDCSNCCELPSECAGTGTPGGGGPSTCAAAAATIDCPVNTCTIVPDTNCECQVNALTTDTSLLCASDTDCSNCCVLGADPTCVPAGPAANLVPSSALLMAAALIAATAMALLAY